MISIKGEGSPGPDAFQTALNVAGSDPETRLRMILGEAYQKYLELCRWTLDELRKDEPKAPGLIALAERFAGDPSLLRFPSAPAVSDTQNIILGRDPLQRPSRTARG